MNDHPLGDVDGTGATSPVPEPSIVDQILDLDSLLSAEVRLAEKTARICTRPDLEADIDDLEAELATLVDDRGNPLQPDDDSLASETGRTAVDVANEIRALQTEMAQSFRSIRMRQLPEDEWKPFFAKHRVAVQEGQHDAMLDELIPLCAVLPKISAKELAQLRKHVGNAAIDELGQKAWAVNTVSGVSVPKSRLSSLVLNRRARG